MLFRDRNDAGQAVARELSKYAERPAVIVLGLPRGGVVVAFEVAKALGLPLDILLVRKLGVPGHEELAMGALGSGGVRVINWDVVNLLGIPPHVIDAVAVQEQRELERQARLYRGDRREPEVNGRTVILVDDGLATGASMRAAVKALQAREPAHMVVAVPIAAPETCAEFNRYVDEVVCAITPQPFYGVSAWYVDFTQVSDDQVRCLLEQAYRLVDPHAGPQTTSSGNQPV